MINSVVLIGRLTKDPELRKTSNNESVCSFTLAVNRRYGKDQADFISCTAWKQSADYLSKYAVKGDIVSAEGSIQTRNYTKPDGTKQYITEVVCNSVSIIKSQKEPQKETKAPYEDDDWYNKPSTKVDISSESLPWE